MATKQVIAFSKYSEQFLFCDLIDPQPKFRPKFALHIFIMLFTVIRHVHYATLTNADVEAHVKLGNIWLALGDNVDFAVLSVIIASLQIVVLQAINSRFINDGRMMFVRVFTLNSFLSLNETAQNRVLSLVTCSYYFSLASSSAAFGFLMFSVLKTFATSFASMSQAFLSFYLTTNICHQCLMTYLLIAIELTLVCRNLLQRLRFTLKVLSRVVLPPTSKLMQMVNNVFIMISKLNHYWKSIIFVTVVANSMTVSVSVAMVIFSRTLPLPVTAVLMASATFVAFNISLQILFPATVYSRAKQLHAKLMIIYFTSHRDSRMTVSRVLKKFERLKAFSLFDVTSITFDLYRGVSPMRSPHRDVTFCLVRREHGVAVHIGNETGHSEITVVNYVLR